MIIFWKQFSASATGVRLREVKCERCGAEYAYELARTASGAGSALYYIAQGAAERRANNNALANLEKMLRSDQELVPCPTCQWVQSTAIEQVRQSSYKLLKWPPVFIAAISILLTILFAIARSNEIGPRSRENFLNLAMAFGLIAAVSVGATILRRLLIAKVDPNNDPKWLQKTTAAAPLALVRTAPGSDQWQTAISEITDANGLAEPCIVQLGRFWIPEMCALCLSTADIEPAPKLPFSVRGDETVVPLCGACATAHRWKAWSRALLGLAIGSAVGFALWFLPMKVDQVGRSIMAIGGGLFLALILAAVIPSVTLNYVRVRVLDSARGVIRLKFKNPAFGDEVLKLTRKLQSAPLQTQQAVQSNDVRNSEES